MDIYSLLRKHRVDIVAALEETRKTNVVSGTKGSLVPVALAVARKLVGAPEGP